MAEQNPNTGGNFVQQNTLFSAEGPVTQFVRNVYEFSDNLSDVIDDIVSFLNVAAVFLRAIKSPLEFLLLPILNSLESYVSDLKNIGAGVLTVWPWEVGRNPSPIDFSALLDGLKKFEDYYSSNETVGKQLTAEVEIQQQLLQNSSAYVGVKRLVDSETLLSQSSPELKQEVLSNYQSLKNFLDIDSSYWDQNPEIQEGLKLTRTFLNKKELTPGDVIRIIDQSFDDLNDPQRPIGGGDYTAFVILAALPSFSGINQIVTQFSNFFGGIFDRVTPEGKEKAKSIGMNSQIDLGMPVQPKNSKNVEEKYFFNQVKAIDVEDGIYKDDNDIIPMFQPGDLIRQTQESLFSESFSAEVVKHNDIVVKNKKILSNVVTVKDVNGNLSKKYSNRKDSNPGIVRRNSNEEDIIKHPMFLPGDAAKVGPQKDKYSILATMTSGNLELTDVFPDIPEVKRIKNSAKNGDDIYNNTSLYDEKLVQKMIDFSKTLSPGKMLSHPFLKTFENESTAELEDDENFIGQSKKLLNFLPGIGLNYHIKDVLIENTETGATKKLDFNNVKKELFRFEEVEDRPDDKIIGMNKIKLKMGRLIGDGSIDDSSSLLNSGVSPPEKMDFFNFSENLGDGRNNPSIDMIKNSASRPPNWKFVKIQDFLPVYGDMIDRIVDIIVSIKSWVKTQTSLIDEAIKFLNEFSEWLQNINQSIIDALRVLTEGLNSTGLYTLSLSGSGGSSDFREKLKKAKFLQLRANPFPSLDLETIEKEEVVINPITGLNETVSRKQLKPVLVPADKENNTPQILSASELDSLKYSMAIVFYAQGTNSKSLNNFLTNFSTAETFLNSFIGNLSGSDTIADEILPYIYDIQVLNSDGEFVSAENAEVGSNLKIRIVFTNEAHKLSDDEIRALTEIQGRSVDLTPNVITTNLHLSQEDIEKGLAEFTLTKDGNHILLNNPPEVSQTTGADGRQFFNVDFSPKSELPASETGESSYIFTALANPLTNSERMEVGETKVLSSGFKVEQTSILDVEINYAL